MAGNIKNFGRSIRHMSATSVPDMSASGNGGSPKWAKEEGFDVDTKGSDDVPNSSGSDDHSVEGIHTEQDLDDLVKSVS
jgi:hypothetical protein